MSNPKFLQFEPFGPVDTGLVEWEPIDSDELQEGKPVQRGHIYHEDQTFGYMAGVWDCTPMTLKFSPYPVHEFMFLLEGSITLALASGSEVTINAGEAFVIPKGLPCQWIQPDYVRKFFMIFENPGAQPAHNVSSQGIILAQPSGPPGGMEKIKLSGNSEFAGHPPVQHNHTYFEDPSGQMAVGVWDTSPSDCAASRCSRNELMCLLEGSVTLTDDAGQEHHFQAGDAVYVPQGAKYGWKNKDFVRMFYAIFEPSGAGIAR